jgi:hypothetical protein
MGQFLQRLGEIYQQRNIAGPRDTHAALDSLEQDLALHAARLGALSDAALDSGGVDRFVQAMAGAGLEVSAQAALVDEADGNVLGWRFEGCRVGADG